MKIAFILNYLEMTGGDRIVWHHTKGLKDQGHEVSVFAQGKLKTYRGEFWKEGEVVFAKENEMKKIDFSNFDLVIGSGIVGAEIVLELNNPNKIFFCQNYDHWIFRGNKNLLDVIYNKYNKFLTYSSHLKKILEKNHSAKVYLCTNGVENKTLSKFRKKSLTPKKRVCFMTVYNSPLKGASLAEEVFGILKKKGFTAVYLNVNGQQIGNVDEYYENLPFEKKCKLVAGCDVMLHTSIFETWCLAVHEAMALGVPVVATDSKGIMEYVNEKNAIIVERNAENIAENVEELIHNKELYKSVYENGIKTAEEFDWGKVTPKIEKTYLEMAEEKKTSYRNIIVKNGVKFIDPLKIKKSVLSGFVFSDLLEFEITNDWDINPINFEQTTHYFMESLQEVLNGKDWKDTKHYAFVKKWIGNGRWMYECKTIEAFEKYLKEMERIYQDIKKNGYKDVDEKNRVEVNISRDGEVLFNNGRHRLAIAQMLGIKEIPINVKAIHTRVAEYYEDYFKIKPKRNEQGINIGVDLFPQIEGIQDWA